MSDAVFCASCCILLLLNCIALSVTGQLRVGGLFEEKEENDELALQLATQLINQDSKFHKLLPIPLHVYHSNPLFVSHTICSLLHDGIVGIIGPTSPFTSPTVKSLCDVKDIPLIEVHWEVSHKTNYSVNLYPHPPELSRCFLDIIKAWGWKSYTILYEDDNSLFKIGELLRMYNSTQHTVTLRQLEANGNHRPILLEARKSGEKHYVIDCSLKLLEQLLQQAQQVGLMTESYHYTILNLDMFTLDLSRYQYGGSNITSVRIIDPENAKIKNIAQRLQKLRVLHGLNQEAFEHLSAWKLKTQTALMIDAVYLLYRTLKELNVSPKDVEALYCNNSDSWRKGSTIMNYMKAKQFRGITGLIKFDTETGVRNDFSLEIVELSLGGLVKVGIWNTIDGLNISRIYDRDDYSNNLNSNEENPLRNKAFKIIIALTSPYGMLKNVSSSLAGNDRYEGYGIDLIEKLAEMLEFNYTFIIQEDGANGNYNITTKQWDGMIGAITKGKADFAIADLTISSERERYVDFTMPFMSLGISILYRKPEPAPPSLFTFASPFSMEVWALVVMTYFLVSLSFFIMGRLSPSEWTNPYPCIEEPEILMNQFSFRNSLWFTIGSLMQQGSEITPLGISTRMAAGVWWFFALVMVSTYTANLAAFLTVEDLVTPFNDVEQLVEQKSIKYGAKANGATFKFFQDSNYSVYPEIREYMSNHPEYMTSINDGGVKMAENDNYAFFMESTTIQYITERHCNLTQVGGALDEKGYGIAMAKNSMYRHALTEAILILQEAGTLEDLKRKWWKEKRGGGTCEKRQPVATPLDLQNLGGVFFVLGVGIVFGIFGTFIEMGLHTYYVSRKNQLAFKNEVKKELHFFLRFQKAKDLQSKSDAARDTESLPTVK